MGKLKPKWQKTNLSRSVKTKLWRIIRDNPTYNKLGKYIARHPDTFDEYEYGDLGIDRDAVNKSYGQLISRDTYKALLDEIWDMPLREMALLPEDLQNWARGLKGDVQLQQSINSLIESQEKHTEDLANAAKKLANSLKPYLLNTSGCLADYVIGNDESGDLEEQLLTDSHTKWLFSHMKAELPQLRDLKDWLDLPAKDIDDQLIETLYIKAIQKEFAGKCKACKGRG